MKRTLSVILLASILVSAGIAKVFAASAQTPSKTTSGAPSGVSMTQALKSSKPAIILLYAPWSDSNSEVIKNMNSLKKIYGNSADFVFLNIAEADAKVYNEYFSIRPNLPYVQLFKHRAKVKDSIPRSCLVDYACVSKEVKSFIN